MLVETQRVTGTLGESVTGEDLLLTYVYFEMRVRVLEHLWGRTYSDHSSMVYSAHAAYAPGVQLLVIAEPRSDSRGFFARWYGRATDNDEFCVPIEIVDELQLRSAFRDARRKLIDDDAFLCYQA